jgi:hypothetical protein
MIRTEREKLIQTKEDELSDDIERLLRFEDQGKEHTSYYMSLLREFTKKLEFYVKIYSRHLELLRSEMQ